MTNDELAQLVASGELAAVVEQLVNQRLENLGPAGPVNRTPNRVPLYHAKHKDDDGKPLAPPTPDGKVWRIDAGEWCDGGDWLLSPPSVAKSEPAVSGSVSGSNSRKKPGRRKAAAAK